MANTLGNLYSSLKTRVSDFFNNNDDKDKNKFQFTPVSNQTVSSSQQQRNFVPTRTFSLNQQSQSSNPIRLNASVDSNPNTSWFNNFNQGYQVFQQQQLADQQRKNQEQVNLTKELMSRNTPVKSPETRVRLKTSEIKPPSFFDKAKQDIKDFATGIQVSGVNPSAGVSAKNIVPNIARNFWDPNTNRSAVAEAMVKAPIQQLEGILPPLFQIKVPSINGESKTLKEVLIPNNTPDEKLREDVSNIAGKAERQVLIYKLLGKLGLNDILPQLRVGGSLLSKQSLTSALDYVVSNPNFAVNLAKYFGGQTVLNTVNTILDEKYKDKTPAQVAGSIAVDTVFSSLLFAGFEVAVGSFGASSFLDNVSFIRNVKTGINGGINDTIGAELSKIHETKFLGSYNPNAPVNNPEFEAWQHNVQEAYKTAMSQNNFGGLMKYMRDIPVAPASYIPELGTGVPSNAMVNQALLSSPTTQMTAEYIASTIGAPAESIVQGAIPAEGTIAGAPASTVLGGGPEVTQGSTPVTPVVNTPPPKVETPQDIIQKSMNDTLIQQKTAQEAKQLEQVRSVENNILQLESSIKTGDPAAQSSLTDVFDQLKTLLDENPKLLTELSGNTIRAMEDANVQVPGADGQYKSVFDALKELRQTTTTTAAESPAITTADGQQAPEQALTNTGNQVVNQGELSTAPQATLGNEQVDGGIASTSNNELAQLGGTPQDTAALENTASATTPDQTVVGSPAYQLPRQTMSKDLVTSKQFPEGTSVRKFPKPIIVDPEGNAVVLSQNPKTTHFIDKVINKVLSLAQPSDAQAIIEGVNNLLPSGERIALPSHTGPLTVATRQQALQALSKLSPGQKIEVFNQLKDGKKVIPLITEEQIQSIMDETTRILSSPLMKELENFSINAVDSGAFKSTWMGGLSNTPQQFKDWVNQRNASEIKGINARLNFDAMDGNGIEAYHQIQQGDKSGFVRQLREYFDSKYQQLKDAGFELGYQENYIPQLWDNTEEEVVKALGDRLSTRPGLTFERFIDDYQTGIEKGLTPRFEKLSDLVGWYESTTNKSIADKKFFTFLENNQLIEPSKKAPRGWITLDPDRFPNPSGEQNGGTYKAPPDVAKIINNYLGPGNDLLRGISGVTSRLKNIVLSGGVPNTGINAHGLNLLVRYTLANKNPVVGLAKGSYYLINPNAAKANLNKSLDRMEFFISHGMTGSTEEHAFTRKMKEVEGNIVKKGFYWLTEGQKTLFEDPLFTRVVPWMKTELAEQIYQASKDKMGDTEAARMAARTINEFIGGINLDELARNKDVQNALRVTILAPDWAETNLRVGTNVVKGTTVKFNDEQYKAYRRFAAAFLGSYIAMNIMNKGMSGHWTWQNEPGNEFNLDTGTYTSDGKKRYVRVYGTAVDFIRIPFEMASGVLKGDLTPTARIIKNRLSTPLGTGVAMLSNIDYTGQKIINPDDSVGQQALSAAATLSRMFLPSQVGGMLDFLGGKSIEESMTRALELPTRYQGGAYTKTQKNVTQILKDKGATGETIGQINTAIKGESLSDTQQKTIAQLASQNPEAALQYVDTLKARRSINDPEGKKTPLDFIKGLFGGGNKKDTTPGAFTPSEDKAIRKEQIAEINARLTAGMEVSKDELNFAYFGDMLDIPSGNSTEKLKAEEDLYKKVSTIMSDEDLSDTQRSDLLNTLSTALDVPRTDIEYYANAKESKAVKFDMITNAMQGMQSQDDVFNFLVNLKKEVNGESIISSEIVTQLYETGFISSDMKKLLGKYRWNPITKEVELSRSSSEGSSKKPKAFNPSVPNISTPKLDLAPINISFKSSNLVPLSTQGSYDVPASLKPSLIGTQTVGNIDIQPKLRTPVRTLSGLGGI